MLLGGFQCLVSLHLLFRAANTDNCLFLSYEPDFNSILCCHSPISDSSNFSRVGDESRVLISDVTLLKIQTLEHRYEFSFKLYAPSSCRSPLSLLRSSSVTSYYDQGLRDELAGFLELQANSIKDKSSFNTKSHVTTEHARLVFLSETTNKM